LQKRSLQLQEYNVHQKHFKAALTQIDINIMHKSILFVVIIVLSAIFTNAQSGKKTDAIRILTSVQCGQCKTSIETAMVYEKGVIKSILNYISLFE